jgi:MSHA biogenesis protein MshM
MYTEHFGLSELPFGITPDTRYTFESRAQRDALQTLIVALQMGEGFVKVTGEVGTGKTHTCRRLMNALSDDPQYRVLFLPNPATAARTLLLHLCLDLGLEVAPGMAYDDLNDLLAAALVEHAEAGRSVVALLDETQAMPDGALEAIRLLSNLETERRKLLRVVMFGQPELDERLMRRQLRQLRQRISFEHTLDRLSLDETLAYLEYRMRVAGCPVTGVFPPKPAAALHRCAQGTPRLINVLAHKCLLLACGEGARRVSILHVEAAVRDTPSCRRLELRDRIGLSMRGWLGAPA